TVRHLVSWVRAWSYAGWLVVALTILGALPRLWDLGGPSFWNDEGGSSIYALAALRTGVPLLPGHPLSLALVNFDPFYPELEGASFRLFGVSQWTARLPAALIGVAMTPIAYVAGRRLAEQYVGLTLAVMVAFSTEYIAWSRQARGYVVFTVLLLLLILLASRWYRSGRLTVPTAGAMGFVTLGLGLTSPGLFILYAPAAMGALVVYLLLAHRPRVIEFFGGPWVSGEGLPNLLRRRWRLLGVGLLVLGLAIVLAFPPGPLSRFFGHTFESALHFAPYPLIWVPFYGSFLLSYYAPVITLAAFGGLIALRRADPFELSLLAFSLLVLLSLSSVLSLVADAAGGAPTYERYLTPDLVLLFYFAALGLVGLARITYRSVRQLPASLRSAQGVPLLYVAVVITVLVLPSMVYPPLLNTYAAPQFSAVDGVVPWTPFSPFPSDPSALYATPQPDFELASEYVLHHERPGDVSMAIWPDAPAFYLGKVDYWAYVNPPPGAAVPGPNGTSYFLTGSLQVNNVSAFEGIMARTNGWFIEDIVSQGALGPNLSLAIELLTWQVPEGSDASISLYHWNASTPVRLLTTLEDHRRDLLAGFGSNLTRLVDWAVVAGVSIDGARPLLVPLESKLLPLASDDVRPLGVLLKVYNSRADLQQRFPEVIGIGNYSGLLQWADDVASGGVGDPAEAQLAPYAAYYESNGR
ncbi:MAG: glycosyltransferase family 39 protein, partial [Thermoplasmata archaeon]|nr:glycosyltransferase family 39 protein [Thermoplasmata archaeon]